MELNRYDIHLKGYMLKSISLAMREWLRISFDAMKNGLDYYLLASKQMELFLKIPYIKKCEILFISGENPLLDKLAPLALNSKKIMEAMIKMNEEYNFDCASCDYTEICSEVGSMRDMRDTLVDEHEHGQ